MDADLAIPTLPARSPRDAIAFYEKLGFSGEIADGHGAYAILKRGSIELHFFAHPALDPASSHHGCYVRVQDVDSLHHAFCAAKLPSQGIPRMDRVEDKPWGMREFALIDADGNLLRIGQEL